MITDETIPSVQPYLEAYLRERPLFFSLIRPQEAALFRAFDGFIRRPVLDVGAGDGFFARLTFGESGIDVGLDLEASRIVEARTSGAYGTLATYDGRRIPFPDRKFATVVSNCVLEHVHDLQHVVFEAHRVLQPGGYFLTSVMADRWEDFMVGPRLFGKRYQTFMRQRQDHANLLSFAGWCDVFGEAGFESVRAVGYLSARTAAYLDIAHYLSVPAIPTRRMTGHWVAFPDLWARLAGPLGNLIELPVPPADSAAIFFVVRRQD